MLQAYKRIVAKTFEDFRKSEQNISISIFSLASPFYLQSLIFFLYCNYHQIKNFTVHSASRRVDIINVFVEKKRYIGFSIRSLSVNPPPTCSIDLMESGSSKAYYWFAVKIFILHLHLLSHPFIWQNIPLNRKSSIQCILCILDTMRQ